jgi:UTP:GlnB (protein PII) uridylyltransferase
MGDERASLEISVRDPRTAEVRVVAPDRPALMRDIARALTKEGFFIDSATISTKDGDVADNVFVIKLISDAASMTSFVDEKVWRARRCSDASRRSLSRRRWTPGV